MGTEVMRNSRLTTWLMTAPICVAAALILGQEPPHAAGAEFSNLTNDSCLGCHGNPGFSAPGADGRIRQLDVIPDKFGKSVHGTWSCVECHKDVTEIPHKAGVIHKVNCVNCHNAVWNAAKKGNKTQANAQLGVVV